MSMCVMCTHDHDEGAIDSLENFQPIAVYPV